MGPQTEEKLKLLPCCAVFWFSVSFFTDGGPWHRFCTMTIVRPEVAGPGLNFGSGTLNAGTGLSAESDLKGVWIMMLQRESILKLMDTSAGEAVCDMLAQANIQVHDLPSERLYELLLTESRRQRCGVIRRPRSVADCAADCRNFAVLLFTDSADVSFQH